MNKSLRRQYLEADLAQVEALLSRIPERRIFERAGFEARRNEIRAELTALEQPGKLANVILSFDGYPVTSGPGIDARFAGNALVEFQEFVSVINAAKKGSVRDIGRVRDSGASRLRVVDTIHGSFGFELQEVEPTQQALFASELSESVESATRLIAAAGEGDDEFIEAVSDYEDARVQSSLGSFLKVVKSAHAVCKVVSDDTVAVLDESHVDAAVDRVTNTVIQYDDESHAGKFAGITLDTRHFDFESNVAGVISGKVRDDVDRATMTQWEDKWFNKYCVATVQKRTVIKPKKNPVYSYTLLSIEPGKGS